MLVAHLGLEPLTFSPTASDQVYTVLGDIYSKIGLNQLAMEVYEQALGIAMANDDTLSKATVQVKLADVYIGAPHWSTIKPRT